MYQARLLVETEDRAATRVLLHKIYIEQMGWLIPERNPSGLAVTPSKLFPGESELTDLFSPGCLVLGLFHQAKLVGTLRLVLPVESRVEVERYHIMPHPLNTPGSRLIEVNRLAVEPVHQQTEGPVHLIRAAVAAAMELQPDFLVTAVMKPQPFTLCEQLGFKSSEARPFRYNPRDPEPVQLMHIDGKQKGSLERIINLCDRILSS